MFVMFPPSDRSDEVDVCGDPERPDPPGGQHQVLHQRPRPAGRGLLHLQQERGRQAEDGREGPRGRGTHLLTNTAPGK